MSVDLINAIRNYPVPDQLVLLRKYKFLLQSRIDQLREQAFADPACWDGLDHEIVIDEQDWHSVRLKEARELLPPDVFERVVNATKRRYVYTRRKTKTPPVAVTTEGAIEEAAETED